MAAPKLDATKLDAELGQQAPARRSAALHTRMNGPLSPDGLNRPLGALSDDELLGRIEVDEQSVFHVPIEMIPPGMIYEWKANEVYGQPHRRMGSVLEAERNGWHAVPASRHDGHWMQSGHEGPILVEGLQLMELPDAEAYNRLRTLYLMAKNQRRNSHELLAAAPAGTGPRSHPGVRPQVSVTREPMAIE